MVENFDGMVNLGIFCVLTLGWAMYAYQIVFGTKAFYDKFGMSHTAVIMGRFLGSFALSAVIMHLYLLFNGIEGAWFLVTFFIMQGLFAAVSSAVTINQKVGVEEGVRYTPEPVVAPLVFAAGYAILLFRLSDKFYA